MPVTATTSRSKSLYTGIAQAKVVAINPTKEELIKMGIPAEREPEYIKFDAEKPMSDGKPTPKVRFEVYFETIKAGPVPQGVRARLSLFSSFAFVANMMTNNYGRFLNTGTASNEQIATFNASAWQKPVYDGEMDLMMLMESLLNPEKGSEFYFTYRDAIFYQGYMAEILEFLKIANDKKNTVQILLGVQTDTQGRHYQTAFKNVMPSWMNRYNKFHERVVKQLTYRQDTDYGPIDATLASDTFRFREWFEGGDQNQAEEEMYAQQSQASSLQQQPSQPAQPQPMQPQPGVPVPTSGPLANAARPATQPIPQAGQQAAQPQPSQPQVKPRFNATGQAVRWAPGDTTSGVPDPYHPDYNPDYDENQLPF